MMTLAKQFFFASVLFAVVARFFLYLSIQFPAPLSDGAIFGAVSMAHCRGENFISPLYQYNQVDVRFLWHAIGQPSVLSFLNFNCSNFGQYLGLSIIIFFTLLISALVGYRGGNILMAVAFITIVFAIQIKSGFRPETTAIFLVLLCEYFRYKKNIIWFQFFYLIAWVQPNIFLLQALYLIIINRLNEWQNFFKRIYSWAPLTLLINGLICYFYPYSITEHIQVLLSQGSSVYASNINLNDFFLYYVKSNFFPFFGLLFISLYLCEVIRNWRMIGLFPLLYFFSFSHFFTVYTLYPLFVVFILNSSSFVLEQSQVVKVWLKSAYIKIICLTTVMALVGLYQGILRDLYSYYHFRSTLTNTIYGVNQLSSNGYKICNAPQFFYIFLSSEDILKMRMKKLEEDTRCIYLYIGSGSGGIAPNSSCKLWPSKAVDTRLDSLSRIFKSDSGYSFYYCSNPNN